jgi:hypothetical protein
MLKKSMGFLWLISTLFVFESFGADGRWSDELPTSSDHSRITTSTLSSESDYRRALDRSIGQEMLKIDLPIEAHYMIQNIIWPSLPGDTEVRKSIHERLKEKLREPAIDNFVYQLHPDTTNISKNMLTILNIEMQAVVLITFAYASAYPGIADLGMSPVQLLVYLNLFVRYQEMIYIFYDWYVNMLTNYDRRRGCGGMFASRLTEAEEEYIEYETSFLSALALAYESRHIKGDTDIESTANRLLERVKKVYVKEFMSRKPEEDENTYGVRCLQTYRRRYISNIYLEA